MGLFLFVAFFELIIQLLTHSFPTQCLQFFVKSGRLRFDLPGISVLLTPVFLQMFYKGRIERLAQNYARFGVLRIVFQRFLRAEAGNAS